MSERLYPLSKDDIKFILGNYTSRPPWRDTLILVGVVKR
jgi:hypothetical protein